MRSLLLALMLIISCTMMFSCESKGKQISDYAEQEGITYEEAEDAYYDAKNP